jgi:hypothetical protein
MIVLRSASGSLTRSGRTFRCVEGRAAVAFPQQMTHIGKRERTVWTPLTAEARIRIPVAVLTKALLMRGFSVSCGPFADQTRRKWACEWSALGPILGRCKTVWPRRSRWRPPAAVGSRSHRSPIRRARSAPGASASSARRRAAPSGRLHSSGTGVAEPDPDASYVADALARPCGGRSSKRSSGRATPSSSILQFESSAAGSSMTFE